MIWSPKRARSSRIVVSLAGLSLIVFTGACSRSSQSKVQDARGKVQEEKQDVNEQQQDVNQAEQNLNQAEQEASAAWLKDFADFRGAVDKKVADNETLLSEKRNDVARATSGSRETYEKMIEDAQKRNSDLRDRVEGYKYEGDAAWNTFKDDINHQLDDVTSMIKNIDVKTH